MDTLSLCAAYLLIGAGFYMGFSLGQLDKFKGSTVPGIIRGVVLGILFWPITTVFVVALRVLGEDLYEPL